MITTTQVSPKIELNNRTLWFDGSTTISEKQMMKIVVEGKSLDCVFVTEITPTIAQYNKFVPPDQQIHVKTDIKSITSEWIIPDEYKILDVEDYVYKKAKEELTRLKWSDPSWPPNMKERIENELNLYKQLNLLDILRALIYIINTLKNNDIVWGVGRGSSVSSYILYLINCHDVDSIKYDLDIRDFLHEN